MRAKRPKKFKFIHGSKLASFVLNEQDRQFIAERDRRQENAGKSDRVLVGPREGD